MHSRKAERDPGDLGRLGSSECQDRLGVCMLPKRGNT